MGIVITDADILELQTLYPLHNFTGGITRQQEMFVLYHLKGLPVKAAAVAAGYAETSANSLMENPKIQAVLAFLRERELNNVNITRDKLNAMLIEAHSHATNTIEEVAAIRELGKMNDLYADAKHRGVNVKVDINTEIKNIKQIEKMDDKQLLELAGNDIVLEPSEYRQLPEDTRE